MPESDINVDTPIDLSTGNESLFSIAAAYFISSSLHEPLNKTDSTSKKETKHGNNRKSSLCIIEPSIYRTIVH